MRNKALESAIAEARQHIGRLCEAELRERYAIGGIARRVADEPRTYGKAALVKLGRELGMKKTQIYEHAQVARSFTTTEFSSATGSGTMRWSHMIELSRVHDPREREQLIGIIEREKLSIADLKKRVAATMAREELPLPSNGAAADQQSTIAIARVVASIQGWTDQLRGWHRAGLPSAQHADQERLRALLHAHAVVVGELIQSIDKPAPGSTALALWRPMSDFPDVRKIDG